MDHGTLLNAAIPLDEVSISESDEGRRSLSIGGACPLMPCAVEEGDAKEGILSSPDAENESEKSKVPEGIDGKRPRRVTPPDQYLPQFDFAEKCVSSALERPRRQPFLAYDKELHKNEAFLKFAQKIDLDPRDDRPMKRVRRHSFMPGDGQKFLAERSILPRRDNAKAFDLDDRLLASHFM